MPAKGFNLSRDPKHFYRAGNGWLFGLCQGLANYSGIHVGWIRLLAVILAIASTVWPVLLVYLIAAVVTQQEPTVHFEIPEGAPASAATVVAGRASTGASQRGASVRPVTSRREAIQKIKERAERITRRIERLESTVTDPEMEWEKRFLSS